MTTRKSLKSSTWVFLSSPDNNLNSVISLNETDAIPNIIFEKVM